MSLNRSSFILFSSLLAVSIGFAAPLTKIDPIPPATVEKEAPEVPDGAPIVLWHKLAAALSNEWRDELLAPLMKGNEFAARDAARKLVDSTSIHTTYTATFRGELSSFDFKAKQFTTSIKEGPVAVAKDAFGGPPELVRRLDRDPNAAKAISKIYGTVLIEYQMLVDLPPGFDVIQAEEALAREIADESGHTVYVQTWFIPEIAAPLLPEDSDVYRYTAERHLGARLVRAELFTLRPTSGRKKERRILASWTGDRVPKLNKASIASKALSAPESVDQKLEPVTKVLEGLNKILAPR
jgi:hypothetical protein